MTAEAQDKASETFDYLLYRRGVRKKDISLLRMYSGDTVDPDLWEKQFRMTVFEREPYPYNMVLARLSAKFGWDKVPAKIAPRLRGISLRENSRTVFKLARCLKYFERLNAEKIGFVVLKGGALKLGLLDDAVRRMDDIDIRVTDSDYHRANEIAQSCGFKKAHTVDTAPHSADYEYDGEGILDIHRRTFKNNFLTKEPYEKLADGSEKVIKGRAEILVPDAENVFLQVLINGLDNLTANVEPNYNPFFIADLIDMKTRCTMNMEKLARLVYTYHLETKYSVAVRLMEHILPGFFAEEAELAGQLKVRKSDVKRWFHQAPRMIRLGERKEPRALPAKMCRSFLKNWLRADLIYLTNYSPAVRPWFFLRFLHQRFVMRRPEDLLALLRDYKRRHTDHVQT